MDKKFPNKLTVYISTFFARRVVCTGHTTSRVFVKQICAHIAREDGRASFFYFTIFLKFYDILKFIKLEPQTLLSRAWQTRNFDGPNSLVFHVTSNTNFDGGMKSNDQSIIKMPRTKNNKKPIGNSFRLPWCICPLH
jgi:hypothetical protein